MHTIARIILRNDPFLERSGGNLLRRLMVELLEAFTRSLDNFIVEKIAVRHKVVVVVVVVDTLLGMGHFLVLIFLNNIRSKFIINPQKASASLPYSH